MPRWVNAGVTAAPGAPRGEIALPGVLGEVGQALADVVDLSSFSTELGGRIASPDLEMLLSPARANVIRPLDLSPLKRVLVIDAGAAAVARHVAEQCGAVDLVERDADLAGLAKARVRDLDHVRVLTGDITDVPTEPTYDAVVWVVERALASPEQFTAVLGAATRRLSADGALVLAIDNPLAARYLSGHADDRTGRPFDAPEGFQMEPTAYLPERAVLERSLRHLGLEPASYPVLSNHRLATAITTMDAFAEHRDLVSELHQPVPGPAASVSAIDERGLWRRLTAARVAHEFAEGYLVVAHRGDAPRLWPADLVAVHFTPRRRVELMTRVDFVTTPEGLAVRRRLLRDPHLASFDVSDDLRWEAADEEFVDGEWLLGALWAAEDPVPLLKRWCEFVRAQRADLLDLNPANIKVTPAGLAMYDQEWVYEPRSVEMKIQYALIDTAYSRALAWRARPGDESRTVREIARTWAQALGVPFSDDDILSLTGDDAHLRPQIDLLPGDLVAMHQWLLDTPVAQLRAGRIDLVCADLRLAAQPPPAPRGPRSLMPARWYRYG
jgi:protein-L-isoaspartate O-methyltransferase